MKKNIIIALLFITTSLFAQTNKKDLTLTDITKNTFAAEYISAITPLKSGEGFAQISKDRDKVIAYSFETGKELETLLNIAEIKNNKIENIDNYVLNNAQTMMLIQTNTQPIYRRSFVADFYLYDIKTKELTPLSNAGAQQTPIFSPDDSKIAFVRANNIFVVNTKGNRNETKVTNDGEWNKIINGIPDWVYEEEFAFNSAMTFNESSSHLCWIKFDESKVKTYTLQMFKGEKPEITENSLYPGEYSYKYPKAGEVNSTVSAWSYNLQDNSIAQIDLPLNRDGYIPRIRSIQGSNDIALFTMNRHQDTLNIYRANPKTLESRLIITETSNKYIKEEALEGIMFTNNNIIIPSDRDGKMHLYLYNMNGKQIRKLSNDKHIVTNLYAYNEKTGDVYYQGIGESPMNREIYKVSKNKTTCLTTKKGHNSAVFGDNFKYFINTWSDIHTPYVYTVNNTNGKVVRTINDNKKLVDKLKEYNLSQREFFSFKTSDNVTLNGLIVKPLNFDSQKKYPVVMYQYSGPGSQQVLNWWNVGSVAAGSMFDNYLTQQDFIVVCVDGRGTGGRGAEFEKCTYLKLGDIEAHDQAETAIYLSGLSYIDKDNIGIWGWSFGGFCTLMSMSEGRKLFKAGVAVAPPTNWKYYDSVYTERYMRTPQENENGYKTNPIERVNNFSGALLLCHGLADDNVHPQNVFEYSESLVQNNIDFKELIYTNRNHGIRGGKTRLHLLTQISNFFIKELKK